MLDTKTVVIRFTGYVHYRKTRMLTAQDLIKYLIITNTIITHEPKECTPGLLRLVLISGKKAP